MNLIRIYLMIGCMVMSQQLCAMKVDGQENAQKDSKSASDIEPDWEEIDEVKGHVVVDDKQEVSALTGELAWLENLTEDEEELVRTTLTGRIEVAGRFVAAVASLLERGGAQGKNEFTNITPNVLEKYFAFYGMRFDQSDLLPAVFVPKCYDRELYTEVKDVTKRFFATLKDQHGETALHYAAKNGYVKLCSVFLKTYKADVNAKCNKGQTPLHLAVDAEHNAYEICKVLLAIPDFNALACIPDVNAVNTQGETPLFHAVGKSYHVGIVRKNRLPILELLITAGADTTVKNNAGKTVFDKNPDMPQEVQAVLKKQQSPSLITWLGSQLGRVKIF